MSNVQRDMKSSTKLNRWRRNLEKHTASRNSILDIVKSLKRNRLGGSPACLKNQVIYAPKYYQMSFLGLCRVFYHPGITEDKTRSCKITSTSLPVNVIACDELRGNIGREQ